MRQSSGLYTIEGRRQKVSDALYGELPARAEGRNCRGVVAAMDEPRKRPTTDLKRERVLHEELNTTTAGDSTDNMGTAWAAGTAGTQHSLPMEREGAGTYQ
ncbi:MAG: hypothetical protein ACLTTO_10390 [Lachnospiraceae bacterium]